MRSTKFLNSFEKCDKKTQLLSDMVFYESVILTVDDTKWSLLIYT